jgi:hypothetical protein
MNINQSRVRIGSVVMLTPRFGSRSESRIARNAVITSIDDDEDLGVVITYKDSDGGGMWAYMSQIQRVIKY